jgi:hypothetical protein
MTLRSDSAQRTVMKMAEATRRAAPTIGDVTTFSACRIICWDFVLLQKN